MHSALWALFAALALGILFVGHSASASSDAHAGAGNSAPVCVPVRGGDIHCHARVVVDKGGTPQTTQQPAGYSPAQFHAGYNLPASAAGTPAIAIVDAYNDPNIESDLAKYSSTFGLPQCTTAGGCFRKINQNGGTSYPQTNAGWSLEIALDVEIAHAICQNCNILLVEANSNSYADLMAAVDRAVASGAAVVSNSYGSSEFSGETAFDPHFNKSGVAITFSSGDGGYGVEYPAASPYVTAVGGTTLSLSSAGAYLGESAWSGAGSGCSALESKPSFQHDPLCPNRTVADVSADADPNTGAAVYDSVRYQGRSGWFKVGGTSLASPLVAGAYALAGGIPSGSFGNTLPYTATAGLRDVVSGSNGSCGTYLCTAVPGYDGPTGLGTPSGIGAF